MKIQVLLVLLIVANVAISKPQAPRQLKCNYLVNPLGMDDQKPRLSWLVSDDSPGAVQTACQIQAAISVSELNAGRNLIWDSGEIKAPRPNVIVVLTDDQGYGDFSCHGNPVLKTPALDKLYGESVRFGNFHVAPVCTPTRGQLMTGLDAMRNKACMVPSGRNIMRRDIVTMPEIFRDNGYQTGIFGKWHLGDHYPDRPMDRGFVKCVWFKGWGLASEIEYDNDYYATRYLDSLETKYSGQYCTDLWFGKAIEWMEQMVDSEKPFFTYLALNAPHGPLDAPAGDREFYINQGLDRGTASFYGMIRNIDQNMAQLDRWLEKKKIKESWFRDAGGNDLKGAYYVRLTRKI